MAKARTTDLGRTRVQTGGAPTYCSTTEGTVSSGTAGATTVRLAHLWHPSTETLAYRIQSITATWAGGSGGDPVQFRIYKTTALGTPGATTKTITQTGGPAQTLDSSTNFYGGHTGNPTRGGIVAIAAASLSSPGCVEFSAANFVDGEPLTILEAVNGGYELVVVTGTAGPTVAAGIAVDVAFSAR